jgi:hypothetical protein
MSIHNPLIAPNYLGWATVPVLSIKTGIDLLARYAVDSSGWSNGEEFEAKLKSKCEEISKAFWVARKAEKVEATIHSFEDEDLGELMDYANSQIEKEVFLEWAKEEGLDIPSEFDAPATRFQSPSKNSNTRWAPKNNEEEDLQNFVQEALDDGCSCDNEQIKEVIMNAQSPSGQMRFEFKNVSEGYGLNKVIRETFKAHYGDEVYKKLRGKKGFKRTRNCKIHK